MMQSFVLMQDMRPAGPWGLRHPMGRQIWLPTVTRRLAIALILDSDRITDCRKQRL